MTNKRLWAGIKKDKGDLRKQTAAKPFAEKLLLLERMRDRDESMRSARTVGSKGPRKK